MTDCSSGTKKLTLSEVLDKVLESDEEEDLSDITESEDEIGDYEDDDGNEQLFFPSNTQIRYFPDTVERIKAFDTGNKNESDDDISVYMTLHGQESLATIPLILCFHLH